MLLCCGSVTIVYNISSMLYDKDAGHTQFLEDLYEHQSRYPAGAWGAATIPYADMVGA